MKPTRVALTIPILSLLALAGCSSSPSSAPATSTTKATTATPASTGSSGGGSSTKTTIAAGSTGTVSEACPTAAVVSAALGSTYPAPQSSSGGGLVSCNYNDPNTSANLVLGFSKATGITDAALKTTAQSQASAQNVTASPVAGLGDAAYLFSLHDASTNASGVATTVLLVRVGSTLIDITAEATPAEVEALGHVLVK